MAYSILKEVTFTPNVFDKKIALESERKFGSLINALDDLMESGIIISMSKEWQSEIDKFVNEYDYNEKSELNAIFEQFFDRNILVTYPVSKDFGAEENNWINQANEINKKRAFDAIVASIDSETTSQINHFDKKTFKKSGGRVKKQTKELMNIMLAPILSYTEIAKVMDPYFSLTPLKGDKNRYIDSLHIICDNLANHHGIKESAIIEIQTSTKAMLEGFGKDTQFNWQLADEWPNIIKVFEDKYKHEITINIWEELKKEDQWHDRWIIVDQCGIYIGKGSDTSEWTDSTWGLLEWEDLPIIEQKFKGRQFNLIGSVTSNGIECNQNPNCKMYDEKENIKAKEKFHADLKKMKEQSKLDQTINKSGSFKIKKKKIVM